MKWLTVCVAAILMSGCGDDRTPTRPTVVTPPIVEACVTNRTGTVTFRNAGTRTADILWNNSVVATLTPGQTSPEKTVVAGGAQYVMDAVITNTSVHPCQILVATPVQCTNNSYSTCAF